MYSLTFIVLWRIDQIDFSIEVSPVGTPSIMEFEDDHYCGTWSILEDFTGYTSTS